MMAKFIKVTQDFRNVTGAIQQISSPVLVNIETVEAIEDSLNSEKKRIIYGKNCTTKFVSESADEIDALIQKAQMPAQPKLLFKGRPLSEADPTELRDTLSGCTLAQRATVEYFLNKSEAAQNG